MLTPGPVARGEPLCRRYRALLQEGRGEFKGLRITTRPSILSEQPLALLEA